MDDLDYESYDASGLAALVASGAASPDDLLDEALARVARAQPAPQRRGAGPGGDARARRSARACPAGPFRGVPFLLKDLGAEAVGFPSPLRARGSSRDTTCPVDSSIVARLRAAGLVIFGRTTAPEGGIGPATEAGRLWRARRAIPGTSGARPAARRAGAGAAVAAGIVPAAHGSDGGGSVRIPASNCGLFGFKATRARFPDGPYAGEGWGGMAIDGFLTRSVRDSAALMDACEGADPGAPYWAPPLAHGLHGGHRPPARAAPGRASARRPSPGSPSTPTAPRPCARRARLLESLGHHVEPFRPEADHEGMIRAWVDIVACGTALWIRGGAGGPRPRRGPRRARLARRHGPCRRRSRARTTSRAIGTHPRLWPADGRRLRRHRHPPLARHGRAAGARSAASPTGPRTTSPTAWAPRASGPTRPSAPPSTPRGQPAASLPLHWTAEGLPVGVQLAAALRRGRDPDRALPRGRDGAALVPPAPAALDKPRAPVQHDATSREVPGVTAGPAVEAQDVVKRFGAGADGGPRPRRRVGHGRPGRVLHAPRPLGLRQDHAPALHRGLRDADRRAHPAGRPRHHRTSRRTGGA